MAKKTQKLEDWKETEQIGQKNAALEKIYAEAAKKNAQADLLANSFQVWKDGQLVFESHYENEAIKTAEKIEAKVIRCLEGCGLEQVYPIPEYKLKHNI